MKKQQQLAVPFVSLHCDNTFLGFQHILFLPCLLQLIWQLCNILHRPLLSPSLKRQHLRRKKRGLLLKIEHQEVLSISTAEDWTGKSKTSWSNLLFERSFSRSLSPSPSAGTGSLPPGPPSEPLSETSVWTAGGRWWDWSTTVKPSYLWWLSSSQFPLPFPQFSGSELWSTGESSLLPWKRDTKLLKHCLSPSSHLISHRFTGHKTHESILSHIHEFKVPPDGLRDLWLCDTDRLYQCRCRRKENKCKKKPSWLVRNVTGRSQTAFM